MKRLLFLLVGSAVIVAFGGAPAFADNGPHVSKAYSQATTGVTVDEATVATDRCAGCHRAHTAQATDLLKQAQPGLCFSCHGTAATGASTDVEGGVGYTTTTRGTVAGALRGGGFQYALLSTANPTKDIYWNSQRSTWSSKNQHITTLAPANQGATTSAHTIGVAGTAWGNGPISGTAAAGTAVTLECTSCHDPHGNGNYRILKGTPDPLATATAVNIPDVTVAQGGTGTYNYVTKDYWESGDSNTASVQYGVDSNNNPLYTDKFTANIASWCTSCHTRYLAPSGQAATYDTGDAIYKYRHRSDALKRLPNDGTYADLPTGSTAVKGGGGANCITCHVSHGSNATMGTVSQTVANPGDAAGTNTSYVNNGTTVTAGTLGDSRLLRVDNRGMCLMCHNK